MVMSLVRGPLTVAEATTEDATASLVRRAASGDRGALEAVLRDVSPTVLRGLRSMMGTDDVDDALQESLLAFVRALPAYRGDTNLRRYALRIGVRTALAARRQERQRSGLLDAHVRATEPLARPPSLPPDEWEAARQRDIFRTLLDSLPEPQAEALALRIVLECSFEEVAEVTGAPVNTVRSRIRLGLEALRARITRDPALRQIMEVAS